MMPQCFTCQVCADKGQHVQKDDEWKMVQHLESPLHGFSRADIDEQWHTLVASHGTKAKARPSQPKYFRVMMDVPIYHHEQSNVEDLIVATRSMVDACVEIHDKDDRVVPLDVRLADVSTAKANGVWLISRPDEPVPRPSQSSRSGETSTAGRPACFRAQTPTIRLMSTPY